ncbi:MAG: sugar ABC transporter ATP-binding protein [Spirochaetia bacterium]
MLEVRSISKSFPGVQALDDVSVTFAPGTIHALLGENGAGKSTLMKIICGIQGPDTGDMLLDGRRLVLRDTFDALKNRISIVHQEIQVVPRASIAENIMLDKLDRYRRLVGIDWKKMEADAVVFMKMVDLDLRPQTLVSELSAAQKQLAQIARALSGGATILLLDEPTSSLTLHEADRLFELLRKLKGQGVTIVFVSHKLEEVMVLCDVVTVLRDGKLIGTKPRAELTKDQIITMMIGRSAISTWRGLLEVDHGEPVLEVRTLKSRHFDGISLSLHKGEILGLYGLVGSGRTELAKTIIGEYRSEPGSLFVHGKSARIRSMAESLHRYSIGYVSENRKEEGLILGASVATNLTITIWSRLRSRLLRILFPRRELEHSIGTINRLDIKTPGPRQTVNNLSGGNQQKVSIAKWLVADCDILIVDEPTVGVDVGAKEYIHDLIWNMASKEGKSIILISSDLPELLELSRRVLVFKSFKIVAELDDLNERETSYEETSQRIGRHLA